ncbi:MAG: twin-arginine translocase subunit TatC [Syntrophales bacterium]
MDKPKEEKLSLNAHLEELRKRLIFILIAVGIGLCACYIAREWLFAIITRPLTMVLPQKSYMIFTSLPEAFCTYMKISFFAALVLTSPYTLYQIWKFISPGLYPGEQKYVLPFVISSSLLFVGGVLFGYFLALPPAFNFFVSFSSDFLKPMLSLNEYLSLSLRFLLGFGLAFELPVFIFFMTKIGLVNAAKLSRGRRYAILVIFIVAAILTPSPDAVTQILMAVPLIFLYEVSIIVAKFAKKRPGAEEEGEAKEVKEEAR